MHSTLLAAAETARYIVHGSRGSYVKYGLDPQEERLKSGERLPQEDWGYDMRDGILTRVEGQERVEETWLTLPGNYPAYYAAIRDALNGSGENPVPASQAIQIMELIELGIESARHRTAEERQLQTVNLRLTDLLTAEARRRRGDIVLVNNIHPLYRRIIGVNARQNAVIEESLQRVLRQ